MIFTLKLLLQFFNFLSGLQPGIPSCLHLESTYVITFCISNEVFIYKKWKYEICGSRCDSIVKKKRFTVRLKGQEGGFQKFSACSRSRKIPL